MDNTPKKTFKVIQSSGNTETKEQVHCIICGVSIERANKRRKIWKDSHVTEAGINIQNALHVNLTEEFQFSIVCIGCIGKCKTLQKNRQTLTDSFHVNAGLLRCRYGVSREKRGHKESGNTPVKKIVL